MILDLGFLNLRQLAEHLGGVDPRTARAVAETCGLRLQRVRNGAPASIAWLDVFRAIHRIEPAHHASILTELKAPLVDLKALADNLGTTAGALRKRELRGRMVLPPAVVLGTLRLWRPRDILHWQLQQPITKYIAPDGAGPSAGASALHSAIAGQRAARILQLGARTTAQVQIPDTPRKRRTPGA